ncbi:MAG: MinD/ParA family protein [Oligoflexia bacterium]|nr:MinD/ParA family protein [Oligoflexia bacterium]
MTTVDDNMNVATSSPDRSGRMVPRVRTSPGVTRVMSFTSGKGGAGKTQTVVNIGTALARAGRKVLILDADLGLANVDVLLGLRPEITIFDVLQGRASLEEVMLDGPNGVSVIPAASGIEQLSRLTTAQRQRLMHEIENIAYDFDYLLIDTGAGIGADVMHFNCASQEIICIVNPEPTSLTDAYALIKVLSSTYGERSISILVNNVRSDERSAEQEALSAYRRLSQAVGRFLQVDLKYLGFIPSDVAVLEAIRRQRALMEVYPSSPAGLATAAVAKRLDSEFGAQRVKGGMQFFFQQLLEMNDNG